MFSSNASQVSNDVKYIEDVCSVYLRTGTGSSQTVTTGIKENTGALVISKSRSAATDWAWYDTFRGATYDLVSNSTAAQTTQAQGLTAFNADGHTWGTLAKVNTNGATYVDTVLKPTPKFFDIVTYTGTGSATTIAHNLGSVPGCIIIKKTSGADNWAVYHRSLTAGFGLLLNDTGQAISRTGTWTTTAPTSTVFSIGADGEVNSSGATYVAYLFAHNAGGFGLTGTDNVIQCGSWTVSNLAGRYDAVIDIGWEPQWILFKSSSFASSWQIYDNMRGFTATPLNNTSYRLYPNSSSAEDLISQTQVHYDGIGKVRISVGGSAGMSGIYMAIRRGPMKVPTSGTSVFSPVAYTGNATDTTRSAGFPVDMLAILRRSNPFGDGDGNPRFMDRLRGGNSTSLISSSSSAEETSTNNTLYLDNSVGFKTTANNAGAPTGYYFNVSTNPYIAECFRRAPSFFDEVCYNRASGATVTHNLGVTPELLIVKRRGGAEPWGVMRPNTTGYLLLNATDALSTGLSATATSTTFTLGAGAFDYSDNYVAYLFATCAGVSKVGSYTGNGSSQTINCGFTGGARFVMIKATSTTGNWIVADSARGIVSGNDPALYLNSTAAEVTGLDWIDADNSGFVVNETATIAANTNGVSYIFFAVA